MRLKINHFARLIRIINHKEVPANPQVEKQAADLLKKINEANLKKSKSL